MLYSVRPFLSRECFIALVKRRPVLPGSDADGGDGDDDDENTGMSGKKATDARGSFSRAMQMATQARSAMAQTVQIVPMM